MDKRTIGLPAPAISGGMGLWEAVGMRRSVRKYQEGGSMRLEELSQLLWAAQGITATHPARKVRAAPSAGACYPIETYVAVGAVEGLAPGLWRYGPEGHELQLVREGDLRRPLSEGALGQAFVARTPVVFCLTLILERTASRYGERAFRYACLDCGHLAQNLALAAVALGYGTCMVGAFDDARMAQVLELPDVGAAGADAGAPEGAEVPLYFVPVGVPHDAG